MTNGARFRRVSGAGPTTTARSYADTTGSAPPTQHVGAQRCQDPEARSGRAAGASRVMRGHKRMSAADLHLRPRVVPLWYPTHRPMCPDRPGTGTHGTDKDAPGRIYTNCLFGWGPKGRWFKSSRPDETEPAPAGTRLLGESLPGFATSPDRRGGLGLAPRHRAGLSARSGSLGCYAPRAGASESRLIRDEAVARAGPGAASPGKRLAFSGLC